MPGLYIVLEFSLAHRMVHGSKVPISDSKLFFTGSWKILYASYDHVQYIWKVVQDHIFTLEKNHSHTILQTNYMARNLTKVWILKNSLSESGW